MPRQRERFLLKEEDRRRGRSSGAIGCAGFGFLVAAIIAVVWRINDSGPPPAELVRPVLWFVAFLLLPLAAGLFLRFRPRHYVDVDVPAGTATVIQGKAEPRRVLLAEAGPLHHVVEERQVRSGKTWRTALFHVVRPAGLSGLVVHESEDELQARRQAESRARAWGVPYVLPSGEVRTPEELDVPLFQRLGDDEDARAPLPPKPGSALSVAWRDGGYEIETTYRPRIDWARLVVTGVAPLGFAGWVLWQLFPILGTRTDGGSGDDPVVAYVFPALAVLLLGGLLKFVAPIVGGALRTWLRSYRLPTIRVSPEGVRYRGRTVPLREIEEVELARGAACRVVSDRRILEIDADFCSGSEHDRLRHELRRLVIEAGQQTPLA